MKITFVTPFLLTNGGNRVTTIYAQGLAERGHHVSIVMAPKKNTPLVVKIKKFLKGEKQPERGKIAEFSKGNFDLHFAKSVPVSENEIPDGDLVIATWWETAEWVAQFSARKGTKCYLIQDHEVFPYLPVQRVENTYRLPLHQIVISNWLEKQIQQYGTQLPLTKILNGVDSVHFHPAQKPIPNPTFGFLHSASPRKNTGLALKLAMTKEAVETGFVFVAFGTDKPSSLPESLQFYHNPPQADIPYIYQQCSAWLFTSKSEGFGLPILEAMACGVPVIATKAGAAQDLVQDGVNGYLVESTPAAFLDAMRKVSNLENYEWNVMSQAARKTALKYDWNSRILEFENALQGIYDSTLVR